MKRYLISFLCLLTSWSLWAATVNVQVKEASVYSQPSSTAQFLGKVPYGSVLTVLESKEGWARVSAGSGLTGWVRSQAFTTKSLNLQSGTQASGASATEVSLAGRGFSEEVEQDYKAKNPTLDFADIDKMEAQEVPEDQLRACATRSVSAAERFVRSRPRLRPTLH